MMKVKVTLMSAVEPEMRRMSFGDNPDFGDLKKKVSELFNETDTEMLFQWKDSEDDMITMSSEEEFQEALKNISDGLLRIFIKRVNDCTNGLKGGNADHENSDFRMNMDNDIDVRPRVWERRLGRGKGCGLGWRSFDASPARRRGCYERKEWRRMRRALKFTEGFDKPEHGCRRFRRRDARKHEDRRDLMRSDDVIPEGGMEECRWTDRSAGCRKIRRCQRPLGMSTDGCRRSRMRKRETMYEMARGMNRCRRANSAPPARFHDENHTRCGRRMRGRFERTRRCRSASLPPLERSSAFPAGSCRRRFGCPKRFLIKLKVKNVKKRGCTSDDESGCNREKKCLGRRCKSYRRRAMMEADKVKENVDAPITPEEDMEPRMETLSLNDDRSDEDMQKDQQDGMGKKERRCKRRKHTYQEDGEDENDRPERRRGKCHRNCRNKYEMNGDVSQPQENTQEEDNNEAEYSDQNRRERRRQIREYRRALQEQSSVECSHRSGKGDRGYHKYVTLKVNMDGNMRPKKLARKLYKIFNQETAMDGKTPNDQDRNHDHEDWSRKDFDWPRYHGTCRRRQARGFRRFRAMSPEFSRRDVGGFRPRGWYRKNCPW